MYSFFFFKTSSVLEICALLPYQPSSKKDEGLVIAFFVVVINKICRGIIEEVFFYKFKVDVH